MHSRIMGMAAGLLLRRPSRFFLATSVWPGCFQPRLVVGGRVGGDAPIERLVLRVALAEPPGDLGPRQLRPEIEGMRAVLVHAELVERARTRPAPCDGRRGCRHGCRPRRSRCGNSCRAPRARPPRSPRAFAGTAGAHAARAGRRHSPSAAHARRARRYMMRRARSCSSTVRRVCGLTCTTSTFLIVQLRDDADQHGGDAGRVGIGQLGEIAGAHQDLGVGTLAPQLARSARASVVKPKLIGSSTGSARYACPLASSASMAR